MLCVHFATGLPGHWLQLQMIFPSADDRNLPVDGENLIKNVEHGAAITGGKTLRSDAVKCKELRR